MITKIELNQVATYKNLTQITELKKVNFFFGNNGCGKSTIARLFYNYSQNEILLNQFKNCSIDGFNRSEEQILVFDSDFIQNNFHLNLELSGIFSLDEKNEEIDKNIKTEYQNVADIEKSISYTIEERQKLETSKNKDYENILEDCWAYNKQFQKDFNKINLGKRREPFFESLVEMNQTDYSYKNLNLISEKYKKYYLEELTNIESSISINNFDAILDFEKEFNNALKEIIIGSNDVPIASIINQLNNSSWIEQGINFLDKNKEVQDCPFCQQQTINKNLLNQFEKYFDTTREEKIKNLEELRSNYSSKVSAFEYGLKALIDKELVKFDVLKIQSQLSKILAKNEKEIQIKIDNPNEKKKLETLEFLKIEIEKVNKNIRIHNEEVDNIKQNQQELTDEIWKYISHQVKDKINSFKTNNHNNSEQIGKLKAKIKVFEDAKIDSNGKIKEWQNQTVNTQKSVDNINDLLLKNNFTGFRIEKKESENNIIKYYILREGETSENHVFKTLSEGEKNFIAFLYFYQLCLGTNDTENSTKKKIIVIDDPVSSMGSQNLFFISTLIRGLIVNSKKEGGNANDFRNQNIEQVFLLTHNSYFYKEISFDKGGNYICKANSHYLIRKDKDVSNISPKIKYDNVTFSEYERLWNELKHDNISNVSMLNCMRRILETYVNFIGLGKDIWNALSEINEDDNNYWVYRSLLSMLHDGSHKINPNEEIYYHETDDSMRENIKSIFENLFSKIGKEHYNMMMQNN